MKRSSASTFPVALLGPVLALGLALCPVSGLEAAEGEAAAAAAPEASTLPPVIGYPQSPRSLTRDPDLGFTPELRPGYVSPPLSTAPELSREYFERGRALFAQRRYGEALAAFQAAAAERKQRYGQALADLDDFTSTKAAKKAKDSLRALVDLAVGASLMTYHRVEVEAAAKGSLTMEAILLLKEDIPGDFADFLRAYLLVVDKRPSSSLKDSLARLRQACVDLGTFPEAEGWMGRIYAAEGDLRLAEFQYRRAWDLRAGLEIPEEGTGYLGELAALFLTQKNYRAYEDLLGTIVAQDPVNQESRRPYRDGMERSLGRDGFDRFFGLYRVAWGPWTSYELDLGTFYLERGRPQALPVLAQGVNALLNRGLGGLRELDPGYEFSTLPALLDALAAREEIRDWAEASGLYAALYRLGLALDANGYRESAREIWRVLAVRPRLEPWAKASSQALAKVGARP